MHALEIDVKEKFTKTQLNTMRKSGEVPGVLYGRKANEKNLLFSVPRTELEHIYKEGGAFRVFDLKTKKDSQAKRVLIKDYQINPITKRFLHVDLYEIDDKHEVKVEVPVMLKGVPEGVKVGGVLDHYLHSVKVKCLPTKIPNEIEVEITHLKVSQSVRIRDVSFPADLNVINKPEQIIAAVIPSRTTKMEAQTEKKTEAKKDAKK